VCWTFEGSSRCDSQNERARCIKGDNLCLKFKKPWLNLSQLFHFACRDIEGSYMYNHDIHEITKYDFLDLGVSSQYLEKGSSNLWWPDYLKKYKCSNTRVICAQNLVKGWNIHESLEIMQRHQLKYKNEY